MRALALAFGLTACGTPLGDAPTIALAVCADDGVAGCAFDFGTRDISVRAREAFTVTNPSAATLNVLDIELIGDPAFTLEGPLPTVVGPGSSAEIVVAVRPNVEASLGGRLLVNTDATNAGLVEVALTITGVDNGIPDIEVTSACASSAEATDALLGEVAVGAIATCEVTLANRGARDLIIDGLRFAEGTCDDDACSFAVTTVVGPGTAVPANASTVIGVRFAPSAVGDATASLEIASSDPDEPLLVVALSGTGT